MRKMFSENQIKKIAGGKGFDIDNLPTDYVSIGSELSLENKTLPNENDESPSSEDVKAYYELIKQAIKDGFIVRKSVLDGKVSITLLTLTSFVDNKITSYLQAEFGQASGTWGDQIDVVITYKEATPKYQYDSVEL